MCIDVPCSVRVIHTSLYALTTLTGYAINYRDNLMITLKIYYNFHYPDNAFMPLHFPLVWPKVYVPIAASWSLCLDVSSRMVLRCLTAIFL